ncbi:MAG: ExeM/NucH family extracellular endonuclease [Pseudomonadota bacterium]
MATVLDEGFESDGNGTRYTTSIPEFSDGSADFFTRTAGADITGTYQLSGGDGFFFAAQDIDGEGAASQQTLSFTGLDISGLTDLSFSAAIAEDDASDGNEDWDASDFVRIEYQIDGGGFQPLLAFENDGATFNSAPSVDSDFDGTGDGQTLTSAFQTFAAAIAGTGSTLDLRITFDLDSGDEDFAIDDIKIVGQSGGATNPAVLAVSGDGLNVAEEGTTTDSFTLQLATDPAESVTIAVTADAQSEISLDGVSFFSTLEVELSDSATQRLVTVRAIDDDADEADPHTGEISFAVSSLDSAYDGLAVTPLTVTVADNDVEITKIHAVQGSGAASPLEGTEVTVEGIVTGLFFSATGAVLGYFVQEEDADADGDAATSEGVFVSSSGATVLVGDKVQVTGVVDEQFGKTEIEASAATVLSSGNALPTAVAITLGIGPDFEALEGMRVELMSDPDADPLTVVTNFNLDRFGEIQVADGNLVQPTQILDPDTQQAEIQALSQANADGRLIIDDSASGSNPTEYRLLEGPDGGPVTPSNFDPTAPQLRLGTQLEDVVGIMDFDFGAYRLQVDKPLETIDANPRPTEAPDVGGALTVASFNVLNYFTTLDDGSQTGPNGDLDPRGAASAGDLARQTEKLVNALLEMDADIIGLQEIENNGFGTGSAIATLVEALNVASTDGTYAFVEPAGTNGGFIGTDAITTGIIYKTDAVSEVGDGQILAFEEASAADTFATASALNDFVSSDDEVGNFQRNRPAVAATFEDEEGNQITVVSNHLKSKGDSNLEDTFFDALNAGAPQELIDALLADPNYDQGDGQGFWNQVRADASAELAAWLETNPTGAADTSNVLILGDLNAYAQENPVTTIEDAGFTDLAESFLGDEAYSFVFDGQRGTLDYGLASADILDNVTGVAEWHIAADEPDLLNYSSTFNDAAYFNGDDVFAASDHDPLIIGLDLSEPPETVVARLDFEERLFRDELIYSLDGEVAGAQRLRLFSNEIEVAGAGISIDSDDGLRFSPSFITTVGEGLGVRSLRGDSFFGSEKKTLDDREILGFDLEETGGLGDALAAEFEFALVRGSGQVALSFFDDGAEVDAVLLDIADGAVSHALDEDASFDRVEIGTTGDLRVTLDAVEFLRLEADPLLFA